MKLRLVLLLALAPVAALGSGCEAVRQNETARSAARAVLTARAYDDIARAAQSDDLDAMRASIERYARIAPGGAGVVQYAREFNEKGYLLADSGSSTDDFEKAEELTRLAVKLYDEEIQRHSSRALRAERSTTRDSLAWALYRRGKLAEAEKQQREALREARENGAMTAELPLHLGDILAKAGKTDEARAAYKEALALRETEPDAHERARAALAKLQ